jgi:hypothetical protein
MNTDDIRRHIVVCDGGDTIDNAIQPDSSSSDVHYLRIVMVTYGLLIRLMLHSAYVLSCRVTQRQSLYHSLELKH